MEDWGRGPWSFGYSVSVNTDFFWNRKDGEQESSED